MKTTKHAISAISLLLAAAGCGGAEVAPPEVPPLEPTTQATTEERPPEAPPASGPRRDIAFPDVSRTALTWAYDSLAQSRLA